MTTFTAERKAELLARIARHEALDTIAKGQYAADRGNGLLRVCAVGCAMVEPDDDPPAFGNWHEAMEEMWGIPAWLGELEDRVFEGLPDDEAATWPRRFVQALPVDVVLGQALAHKLAAQRLRMTVLPLAPTWPESVRAKVEGAVAGMAEALENDGDLSAAGSAARSAASTVAAGYGAGGGGGGVRSGAAACFGGGGGGGVRSGAMAMAWSTAELAACSAAWSAAWSTAEWARVSGEAAAWSTESVAWSAERSTVAWSTVRSAAWTAESVLIISTLQEYEART